MTDFDYKSVAQKMREHTAPPAQNDLVQNYAAKQAIYALIYALEAMDD